MTLPTTCAACTRAGAQQPLGAHRTQTLQAYSAGACNGCSPPPLPRPLLRAPAPSYAEGCSQRPSECWVVESQTVRTCVRDDRKCLQGGGQQRAVARVISWSETARVHTHARMHTRTRTGERAPIHKALLLASSGRHKQARSFHHKSDPPPNHPPRCPL